MLSSISGSCTTCRPGGPRFGKRTASFPGGRLYAEEVLRDFIAHPFWRRVLEHPQEDRFDHEGFLAELRASGFRILGDRQLGDWFGWYVAEKRVPGVS